MLLEATLIVSTVLPSTNETLANALEVSEKCVLSTFPTASVKRSAAVPWLLNTTLSPTL